MKKTTLFLITLAAAMAAMAAPVCADGYSALAMDADISAIVATDCVCAIFVFAILAYMRMGHGERSHINMTFRLMCYAALARLISDAVSYRLDGVPGTAAMIVDELATYLLLISIFLILSCFAAFLYYFVSARRPISRMVMRSNYIILFVIVSAVLIGRITCALYYFDEASFYHRSWAYGIYIAVLGLCLFALFAWIVACRRALTQRELVANLILVFISVVGIALHGLFPQTNAANVCLTLGICTVFLLLQSDIIKKEHTGRISTLDELEGLGQMFTGIYSYDRDTGRFNCSSHDPEYSEFISDGALDLQKYLGLCVEERFRRRVGDFFSRENIDRILSMPEKTVRELEYTESYPVPGIWRCLSFIFLPSGRTGRERLYLVFRDVTYEKLLAEKSEAQSRRFLGVAAGIYRDICEWNMDDDSALRLYFEDGEVREEPLGITWPENMDLYARTRVDPEDLESFEKLMPENTRHLEPNKTVVCSYRTATDDGKTRWMTSTVRVFDEDGHRIAMYMEQDVNEALLELNHLRSRSEHDPLTDLFNRLKLDEMREGEYQKLDSCGVLFFDINYLKRINDTHGHDAGDAVIRLAADSVRSIMNRQVMCYRIGGDEMLAVAANCTREELDELCHLWRARLEYINERAQIKCSMAVGSAWGAGVSVDELIRIADAEMYRNKRIDRTEEE